MRGYDAPYDPALNVHSENQAKATKALFEIIQDVRKQASEQDKDSPGRLTGREALAIAFERFPDSAEALGLLIMDEVALGADILSVSTGLVQQLDVFGSTEKSPSLSE